MLVIGAPFGNYLRFPGTLSTLGTFTWQRRGGWPWRLWRVLATVRPVPGGWVNRLGLPNPGLMGLRRAWGCILSIKGFDAREWQLLAERALHLNPLAVELNLSCPNVKEGTGYLAAVQVLKGKIPLIRKLPPLGWQPLIDPDIGTWYHCCNTLPSVRGGVSGKRLKPYSLHLIEILRRMFGSRIQIIGGGGVTTAQDVRDYHHAGADHVSVASLLLNPLAWYKVPLLQEAEGECNGRAGQRAVLG